MYNEAYYAFVNKTRKWKKTYVELYNALRDLSQKLHPGSKEVQKTKLDIENLFKINELGAILEAAFVLHQQPGDTLIYKEVEYEYDSSMLNSLHTALFADMHMYQYAYSALQMVVAFFNLASSLARRTQKAFKMAIFEGAGKLVPSLSNVADNWCLTTSIALYGQLYAMRFLKNDEYKHFLKIWGDM